MPPSAPPRMTAGFRLLALAKRRANKAFYKRVFGVTVLGRPIPPRQGYPQQPLRGQGVVGTDHLLGQLGNARRRSQPYALVARPDRTHHQVTERLGADVL